MAVGAAIAERFLAARFGEWMSHKIYTFVSDGSIQEEISQGAGRVAGHLGLHNLIMFYDANNIQLSTKVDEVDTEDIEMKYKAWNWNVISVNGNNAQEIYNALESANKETKRPTLIIGKTTMGIGCLDANGGSMENKVSTHGQPLSNAGVCIPSTIKNLGGDPENPFVIFDEVKELYAKRKKELIELAAKKKAEQATWEKQNPELAEKLKTFFSGEAPKIDYSKIEQKPNQATRAGSATVLGVLAENVENMIVASADLSNSDKTDGFLKKTHPFVNGDFSGAFFNAGVSELTMACIMNGIALHGGIFAACGTFFAFSDYMKPAYRMSALMRLPVKYIWSHDAFRVGEDGPTHQPIEQEAQVRLMEHVKNHKGKNSMLVLRPADVHETTVAWKMAMESTDHPVCIVLTRQDLQGYEKEDSNWKENIKKGAYVAKKGTDNPDITVLATGSEVSMAIEAANMVSDKNIRVVSIVDFNKFDDMEKAEQDALIGGAKRVVCAEAGISANWKAYATSKADLFCIDRFGESGPANKVAEHLGFTASKLAEELKK